MRCKNAMQFWQCQLIFKICNCSTVVFSWLHQTSMAKTLAEILSSLKYFVKEVAWSGSVVFVVQTLLNDHWSYRFPAGNNESIWSSCSSVTTQLLFILIMNLIWLVFRQKIRDPRLYWLKSRIQKKRCNKKSANYFKPRTSTFTAQFICWYFRGMEGVGY